MSGVKFLNGIDLVKTQIQNAIAHLIAGDASSPSDGQFWYNSSTFKFRGRANGTNVTFVNDGGDLTAGSVANTALTTNPLARANHTGTQASATISDLATVVKAYRLDEFAAPNTDLAMGTHKITGLSTPTAGTDAANKQYVDDNIAGLSWKNEVRVATTTAGTLATSFANGQVIDGQTLATNDRILIKDQAAPETNGIYVVQASGAPVRATDADTAPEMLGAAVFVQAGTVNAGLRFVNNAAAITLGTTPLTFVTFGGGNSYTAGNGLTLSTNDFNVGAGNGITVAADSVAVDPAVVVRKSSGLIGTGAATAIAYTHSLNTKDVTYSVRTVSDDSFVMADAVATDVNTLTLTFAVAPTTNQYRVTVHG